MFVGHFAAGLGAKAVARKTSLGALFLGAQFLDLLWPTLLLLGLEHVRIVPGLTAVAPLDFTDYPISHSLVAAAAWGVVVGAVYWLARRNRAGAVVVGLLVLSHWLLDFIVHRPDLPLFPGDSPRVGLELWRSLPWTVALEMTLLALGLWLYTRATRPADRAGSVGLWALAAILLLIDAANLAGPAPPSVEAIAWAGQAQWLLVAMGWWVDRHREVRLGPLQTSYSSRL